MVGEGGWLKVLIRKKGRAGGAEGAEGVKVGVEKKEDDK